MATPINSLSIIMIMVSWFGGHLALEQTSQRFDIPIRTLFRWQQKIAPCLTRDKPATKIDTDALTQSYCQIWCMA